MREPKTNIPGLILNTSSVGGRIAYLPADLNRQFGRYNLPDHGNLLANLTRWAAKDDIPLAVECAGLIDCNMYRQPGRLILHLVNLTSAGTWCQPVDEFIPIGPVKVRVKLPEDMRGRMCSCWCPIRKFPVKWRKVGFSLLSVQFWIMRWWLSTKYMAFPLRLVCNEGQAVYRF